jgi:hypothetical protein
MTALNLPPVYLRSLGNRFLRNKKFCDEQFFNACLIVLLLHGYNFAGLMRLVDFVIIWKLEDVGIS